MYGNHFPDVNTQAECLLLPRIMSINSPNFDFAACNFTERLMCCKYVYVILIKLLTLVVGSEKY